MSKYLKKRYTWLGIIAVVVCILTHFNLIALPTSMYVVGTALGWCWGYDYCNERVIRVFRTMCQDCGCDDCQEEEPSNNNSEEQ